MFFCVLVENVIRCYYVMHLWPLLDAITCYNEKFETQAAMGAPLFTCSILESVVV